MTEGKWSPEGERIVYVTREPSYFSGRLQLLHFDLHSGQVVGRSNLLYEAPVDPGEWSPDGRTLVIVLQNSRWNHLNLRSADGYDPKQITAVDFEDADPAFSPDG